MTRLNDREKALKGVQQMDFIRDDIGLYLNTHPGCEEALHAFGYYAEAACESRQAYEVHYGALTQAVNGKCNGYDWVNHPWPWEVEA